jgi:hypothetical protein
MFSITRREAARDASANRGYFDVYFKVAFT